MALQSLGLGLLFTATDRASKHVVGLTKNVRGLEGQAGRTSDVLQTGIGGAAAVALGAGITRVVSRASQFEFGLAKVQNIAMATAEDMIVLRDAAFEAGLKTQFSPTEAVEGLQNLAAAGFNAAESARLLDRSLLLAQAGQISIGQATATVATSIKLFNLQGRNQAVLVDKLLKTTNLFKIQAGDLEGGIAKTAAAALLTNQSIDEMLLTVGLIKNIFPDAGEAGNSISRAMQNMAQKADIVKKTFKTNVIDPKTGGFKNALDLFIEIDAASKRLIPNTAKRAKELSKLFGAFGVKGFAAALASIDEFRTKHKLTREEAVQQLRGEISGAEGTADAFLKGLNSTFEGQRIILEGAVDTLMVAIGEPLLRILQPAVERTAGLVSGLARAIRDMDPALKDTLSRIALVASGFLALGGTLALIRVGAIVLAPVLKSVAISMGGVVLAAAPLLLVGGVLVAAIQGIADAFSESEGSTESLTSSMGSLALAVRGVLHVLQTGGIGEFEKELEEAGASGLRRFLIGVARVRGVLISFFSGIRAGFRAMAGTLVPALASLGSAFVRLGEALGFVADEGDRTTGAIPSAGAFRAGATAAEVMSQVLATLAHVMAAVVSFSSQVVTGVRDAFSNAGPVLDEFGRAIGTLTYNLGITAGAFADGESGGQTFGESLGAMIGELLILGIRLMTVMIDATTHVVAGFKEILPVVRPIFEFLADNIEVIAILFGTRLAVAAGISAVRGVLGFAASLRKIVVGGINKVLHALSMVPILGAQAHTALGIVTRGVARVGMAAFGALKWVASLVAKIVVMTGRAIVKGLSSLIGGIRGIGAQAAASTSKVGSLQNSVSGLGGKATSLGSKFLTWGGALGAAALAGWELGSALDDALGLSESIGSAIADWTGESEKARHEAAVELETEENRALRVLDAAKGRKGAVVGADIIEGLVAKEQEFMDEQVGIKAAREVMLEKASAEELGLTPEEAAARTLLKSGLVRTEQFDVLARGAKSRFMAGAQAVRGGVESIPIIGDRIAAALAQKSAPTKEMEERVQNVAEQVAVSQTQIAADLAITNALLRANANRPIVLQGDGRELARFTQEGMEGVDADLFDDVPTTGALD